MRKLLFFCQKKRAKAYINRLNLVETFLSKTVMSLNNWVTEELFEKPSSLHQAEKLMSKGFFEDLFYFS